MRLRGPRLPGDHRNAPAGSPHRAGGIRAWMSRLGLIGFGFFLVKGLLWLLIPWLIAKGLWR